MTDNKNRKVLICGAGSVGLEAARNIAATSDRGIIIVNPKKELPSNSSAITETDIPEIFIEPETRAERRSKARKKKRSKF